MKKCWCQQNSRGVSRVYMFFGSSLDKVYLCQVLSLKDICDRFKGEGSFCPHHSWAAPKSPMLDSVKGLEKTFWKTKFIFFFFKKGLKLSCRYVFSINIFNFFSRFFITITILWQLIQSFGRFDLIFCWMHVFFYHVFILSWIYILFFL